jgi:spore coat polysaccharide biosynthesis protein SpsF (cytidylyltransferase family)
MGSTRLPGKVLMTVLGKPLLSYELGRLRQCALVERIVLATSDEAQDDPVAELGQQLGYDVFRGSEGDVLDRYHGAAETFHAAHVMRVTGDCPLIDPEVCDLVVTEYFKRGLDYCATGPTFAEGLDCEVFSRSALDASWRQARLRSEREHVTLHIRNNPGQFRSHFLAHEEDCGHYRLTVDETADFEVVARVLAHFQNQRNFRFPEVRTFLDAHPEIQALNSSIVRNSGLARSLAEDADA